MGQIKRSQGQMDTVTFSSLRESLNVRDLNSGKPRSCGFSAEKNLKAHQYYEEKLEFIKDTLVWILERRAKRNRGTREG